MKEKKQAIVEWKMPTVPDKKALAKRAEGLLAQSKGYIVKSEDHYTASWPLLERHNEAIKKIEALFDPFIAGLYKLHGMAIAMKKEFLAPVLASKDNLENQRKLWRGLKEEAQRKRDAEAAKLLQAQQRKDLEKLAKAADRQGDNEAAIALRAAKADTPLPVMSSAPAVPKQQGSVIRKRWVFEIVAPAEVQREYCSPDSKLIRPVVESLGPACNIKGLRIWEDEKEHSRAVPHAGNESHAG